MSKPILITIAAIATIILLGLSVYSVNSHLSNVNKEKTIEEQSAELDALMLSLKITIDENNELQEKVSSLESYIVELEDKIIAKDKIINELRTSIANQEQNLRSKENAIKEQQSAYFALEQELKTLKALKNDFAGNPVAYSNTKSGSTAKSGSSTKSSSTAKSGSTVNANPTATSARIKELTKQLKKERVESDAAYAERVNQENELALTQEQLKQKLMEQEVAKRKEARIRNIIEISTVNFKNVYAREFKDSKNLKRIGKNGKNWNYTVIEFLMQNTNMMNLIDEFFIIQIQDADTKVPLAHIETNPAHPYSHNNSTGKIFQYNGDLVTQYFKNTDLKEGDNYEIQILLMVDGKAFPLKDGTKQFIFNKRPMKYPVPTQS